MMKGCGLDGTASASISSGKRDFSRKRKRRSSSAASSSVRAASTWPIGLRRIQRRSETTQSSARTALAIVELQAFAQGDGAGPAVILEQVALGHLRMGAELVVHAIERVPDHVAMVADDVGGDRDRVQPAEIGLRHEAQHPRPGRL